MIRRLKQNVMNQLPPKKRFQVPITPSKIASEFDDASIDISQLIKGFFKKTFSKLKFIEKF